MNSSKQGVWVTRRSQAGQWATGTLKALAAIALSALLVWIAVSVVNDSGLLAPASPAERDSPAGGSPFAQVAYG